MFTHKPKFILLSQLIATLNNSACLLPPLANVIQSAFPECFFQPCKFMTCEMVPTEGSNWHQQLILFPLSVHVCLRLVVGQMWTSYPLYKLLSFCFFVLAFATTHPIPHPSNDAFHKKWSRTGKNQPLSICYVSYTKAIANRLTINIVLLCKQGQYQRTQEAGFLRLNFQNGIFKYWQVQISWVGFAQIVTCVSDSFNHSGLYCMII